MHRYFSKTPAQHPLVSGKQGPQTDSKCPESRASFLKVLCDMHTKFTVTDQPQYDMQVAHEPPSDA